MRNRTSAAVLGLILALPVFAGPIERVEPPFWWTGFEHTELQVMVHGHGTAEFDVSVDHPGITLNRVERVESENYLFIYLDIGEGARPGVADRSSIRPWHQARPHG